jgi:hypothetical protein
MGSVASNRPISGKKRRVGRKGTTKSANINYRDFSELMFSPPRRTPRGGRIPGWPPNRWSRSNVEFFRGPAGLGNCESWHVLFGLRKFSKVRFCRPGGSRLRSTESSDRSTAADFERRNAKKNFAAETDPARRSDTEAAPEPVVPVKCRVFSGTYRIRQL